jgi:hypothetical protein
VAGFADRACPVVRARKCEKRPEKYLAIEAAKSPPTKALLLNANYTSQGIITEAHIPSQKVF